MNETEHETLVDAAYALLMAAILIRDMAGAMPVEFVIGMPEDIRNRFYASCYQDAFDQLPADIRAAAHVRVSSDPDIQRARTLHRP